MKYNNQITITNGVLPVEANKGQVITMTVVLKDFATGQVHRTHKVEARFTGLVSIPTHGREIDDYWLYTTFEDATFENEVGHIKFVGEAGWPLAQFINV